MYNPMQSRIDSLLQQKQMIDSQLNALQQYQIPAININNMSTPQTNYDFNGKWVDSESEARGISNNTLPLILFDKNNPIFYMKQLNGEFKKFSFTEIADETKVENTDRIDMLEKKLDALIESMSKPKKESKDVKSTA